ncbi:GNAT family N-acetyltransferase [Cesiribacter sp. SM1]|uniref:GNAT family N-acetyltransferase n=1 Tax=Cesiribacter sp. SM1 TaxID=2861196 RepID=UPI001CD36592|nr:GNAT family N-acetyltransferase [Cesiribacter sp. SM1]
MALLKLTRTDSENPDFRRLVLLLDQELAERDGDEHAFFAQFNKIDKIQHVVVAYHNDFAIGCGAIKEYENRVAEVKRMFVQSSYRGQGIAGLILQELERWASALNYHTLILETGKKQPEAIALYKKSNYHLIPNYGQYAGVDNSVCMKKTLKQEQADQAPAL